MIWIFSIVCILLLLFAIRLFRLKHQLCEITAQLNELTNEKTEKKVTVALIDSDLNHLAAAINRNLELQKKLRIDVRRSDLQLKDSIANLSHDLRTPLTSILGYLQLSQSPQCPAEKQKACLKIVNDKANILKDMIGRLYELSVLDIQEAPLQKGKIDLNLLLSDILAEQYELFQKLGMDLTVSLPNCPVWITGDRVACTRIIQNLLSNSARYAKGNVRVELTQSAPYALLSICNPAPNLKEEDVKHLFERFYTADKSRNSGGSGLGLSIVKTLLTKMDGIISDVSLDGDLLKITVGFLLSE
jgi:signal transduction histidine kinase